LSISEVSHAAARSRSPQDVVDRLDGAFAVLVEILDRHGGIVNKFLGDGFLALFGAPFEAADAAHRAVDAAREMLEAMNSINAASSWPLQIGIGIHFGEVVAGNIGSPRRKEYTVIGDTVNFAARLESLNKEFNSQLLISAAVRDALDEAGSDAVSLGEVAIRGYDQPMTVWQLGVSALSLHQGNWHAPAALDDAIRGVFRLRRNRRPQMQRRYITVDVFTDRAFGGNPLAVVLDAGGLSTAQMQAIASEFNYSETTFVLPPQDPTHDAQVRIFTVNREIPFAGHPNVGTAFVLATQAAKPPARLRFEEKAGLVPVEILTDGDRAVGAELTAPQPLGKLARLTAEQAAACLSLTAADIRNDLASAANRLGRVAISGRGARLA